MTSSDVVFFHAADARPYGAFSNFARYGIFVDDHYWPTVEHYFQAQKFAGTPHLYDVLHAPTPEEAKRIGQDRARPLRDDWSSARIEVMRQAVTEKFLRYPELQKLLLDTGSREIVKDSRHDLFWGRRRDGAGQNMLGRILMDVRTQLRAARERSRAEPPLQALRFELPASEGEAFVLEGTVLTACAMRFDGDRYAGETGFDPLHTLEQLQAGEALELSIPEKMTLFFMLQRYLMKWGGELLAGDSPPWRLFRSLFLELYAEEVPVEYRRSADHDQWRQVYGPDLEAYAQWIREIHEATKYHESN